MSFDWQAELALPAAAPLSVVQSSALLNSATLARAHTLAAAASSPARAQLTTLAPQVSSSPADLTTRPLSFAAALTGAKVIDDRPFPSPCIKGDALSIKICQEEYRKGVEDCSKVLRARLILSKGDKPLSAREVREKVGQIWKTRASWKMVPLGRGFYDFHFESVDDLKNIWAAGMVNLKPGLLRFSQWTKDFKLLAQKQTHVSLWIHLVELPQEYWRERTLKEIASAVGTPIDIDEPTRNRTFGHYARILVDIDLSKKAYDEVLVERDGFAFMVEIQYERRPLFCHHCYSIGHNITTCRWLNPQVAKEKVDRGKQPIRDVVSAPHQQHKGGGASTSALGGAATWIPIPSTVTTTTMISVTAAPTIQATSVSNFMQSISVSLSAVPISDSLNSFSIPLHNVFDCIDRPMSEEITLVTPVLEKIVSPIVHDDVQPVEVGESDQTSREELERPTLTNVTTSLLDSAEHNHGNPREPGESPKGPTASVSHLSPLGREDIRPVGEAQLTRASREELENPTVDDFSEPL